MARTSTSSVYLAVLDKTQPSPFAPESDEEKAADDKKPGDIFGDRFALGGQRRQEH